MFGIDDAIAAATRLADDVVTRIWPDATEIEKAKITQISQEISYQWQSQLAQIDLNKVEAGNASIFVSGWRPFVGWVCGGALAYAAILEPLARFIANVAFGYVGVFPVLDTEITLQLLIGLLGLGGFRTVEKMNGVARAKLKG